MLRTGMAQIGTCKTKEATNHTKICHLLSHCICGNAPLKLFQTVTLTEAYNTSAIYAPGGSTNLYALNWNGSFVGNDNAYRNRTKHSHTINNAGEDEAHENMPPFATLYMWQRTA